MSNITHHRIASHEEWIAERKELLAKEKEFTRLRDELSARRRDLPWERCRALDDCLAGGQTRRAPHAVLQGLRYGVLCLGCCAALMSLLFVGGLMNVAWAAATAIWVLDEKILPWGGRLARLGAVGLIAGGISALGIALVRG